MPVKCAYKYCIKISSILDHYVENILKIKCTLKLFTVFRWVLKINENFKN